MIPQPEFAAATAGLLFAKDFHVTLRAEMADRMAPLWFRVRAAVRLFSWGHQYLHAVDDSGRPLRQRDLAVILECGKAAVCKAVGFLIGRGWLEDDGRLLVPAIRPKTPPEDEDRSGFVQFIAETWKVSDPETFSAWSAERETAIGERAAAARQKKVAEKAIARLDEVAGSAYEKFLETQQNRPAIEEKKKSEVRTYEPSPEPETSKPPAPAAPEPPPSETAERLRTLLAEAGSAKGLPVPPDDRLVAHVAFRISDEGLFQAFLHKVNAALRDMNLRVQNWGFFRTMSDDVAKTVARGRTTQANGNGSKPPAEPRPDCSRCGGTGERLERKFVRGIGAVERVPCDCRTDAPERRPVDSEHAEAPAVSRSRASP
jgi:hypothetical protein